MRLIDADAFLERNKEFADRDFNHPKGDEICGALGSLPSAQPKVEKDTNVPINDCISRRAAIDAIHGAIIDFFDICDDDDESPMTYKDKLLLEINKAISGRVKQLPSVQPERKKGKWNPHPFEKEWDVCSSCGTGCKRREREFDHLGQKSVTEYSYQYCPWCGADMRGDVNV